MRTAQVFGFVNGSETSQITEHGTEGPRMLLFSIYINDVTDRVSSNLWLFADGAVAYSRVSLLND